MPEYNGFDGVKKVETNIIKCKSCGGTMIFDPATQSLKCEHCGNTEKIDKDKNVIERDIEEGFEKAVKLKVGEQVVYKCHNCGAEVVLNADESAAICPFCSTSNIIKEEFFEGIKPQVVVPFKFGGETASEYAKKWAKRRIFAPRKFKKTLESENMRGVYEPCFTFDSHTFSSYRGRVGDRHTRTVGSGKNRRTETYIVYRNVSGTYDRFFDDVLVANNANFDQSKLSSLSPFDLSSQVVYERKYLAGYCSEVYQRDVKGSWSAAKGIMDDRLYSEIKSTLHCDVVDYLNISTEHTGVTYKYLLLPIYFMSYRFKGKDYGVMINGSNGRASGKTPISPIRVIIAAILGLALLALFLYLFSIAE
ncbi:MAG: hypothetical protein J5836_02970 [Clostridia bacterium]|nr:hypothetical protein [Clostridia bacterium]